ncbi:MFS transporter [Campylobacter lari]|uniref:MFS transporter n=1 Tax=Campylobacter lari TaxID=201 RepID=UPI0013891A60|nr:MFS transporter [Campylobacter lari]EAH5177212.1 MFS transporter [Campylobacter lari]EAI3912406.1 MFS transporter [Campylobacter lari]EAK0953778.1 MFS transporter [Campylobacter lari]ECK1937557.1 MFS transporter [Campylobacter lari]ECL7011653.1 MFS transporter [Campylobacter lari]
MLKTLKRKDYKTLSLSSLGGALEFYDFVIFVFFANYIAKNFFPSEMSDFWKLLNTYGTFAAGYLARPLGGIVMAHFGDKLGRKKMFMLSILLMVLPTFSLAFIPTYESIGYLAPVFLLFIRIAQGIAIGGELPGAWVFAKEHAPEGKDSFYISAINASMAFGILLGCVVSLAINYYFDQKSIYDYAWRIPFAIGGFFGIISIYLRKFLDETPVFKKMYQENNLEKFPLKTFFKEKNIFLDIIASMLLTWMLTACVIILILLMPNFISEILVLNKIDAILIQMIAIVILSCGTLLAGIWVDKFGFLTTSLIFTIGFSLSCFFYFYFFYAQILHLSIYFYFIACFFGGINALAPILMCKIFKPSIRFSGISFSYNIAYAIAGGFTPQLVFALHSLAIRPENPFIYGIFIYILFLSSTTLLATVFTYKKLRF